MQEVAYCRYCYRDDAEVRGGWVRCKCGISWVRDMPDMTEYYRGEYRKRHPVIVEVAKKRAEFIKGMVSGKVLDVGCGEGYLLRLGDGWEGVDPDPRKMGEKYGRVYSCMGEVTGHYDWLVASHVIEHLSNPLMFVGLLRGMADRFLFIVPLENYGEPHLHAFSEDGFRLLVERSGIEIIESGYNSGFWVIGK